MTAAPSLRPCPQCGTACDPDHQYCPGCGFPIGAVVLDQGDRLVGQTLPGGYQILDLLSVGGMGRVYRAEQRALGRTVAVKVIHPHLLADENSIVRFMTEARAASQLNHPNSVSVIDFGKTNDGQPYLVMEFLRGKDLARVSYEQGPLPFKRIVDVLAQVLHALSEAHDLEIVHRDLKPENIILEPLRRGGDFVKVVDFGLAKLKADTTTPNVTMPGIVCGTPDYMAPEQGRGDPIDGRSDLYGVGVVLFQLLTGRLPFESENPTQVVLMHLSAPVPDPTEIAPERAIPEPLVRVVRKSLEKNAEDRYQDAAEFADALAAAMEEIEAGQRAGAAAFTSIRPGGTTECPSCQAHVPVARFCCDCGERLPLKTERPTARALGDLPPLPLRMYARDDDVAWLQGARLIDSSQLLAYRVVADAGMGKTRLVQEFLERAKLEGDVTVTSGPDPYGAEVAFYTLREAIYGLTGIRPGSGSRREWRDAREEEQRGLNEIFGVSEGQRSLPPTQRRDDIDAAFRWALDRATARARGARVILAIEDLERVDTASLSAIKNALKSYRTTRPITFIATHSPLFDPGWGTESPLRILTGLPASVVTRLMGHRASAERLSLDEMGKRGGVAPLYFDQVIRFLNDGGTEPPSRLADLIAHRLGTLPPAARQVLQALAVLGERGDIDSMRVLLGADVNVKASLDLVGDGDMIERHGDQVHLRHPLFREVILLATPAGVRVELHRRTIRLFDKQGAPIEARALHAYHSQESLEALLLLEQIAERAMMRNDEVAAINALRRGLDLSRRELSRGELDDPMRAMAIFGRKLGEALTQAGNFADAEGVLREALDMTGPSGTDRSQILAALARCTGPAAGARGARAQR